MKKRVELFSLLIYSCIAFYIVLFVLYNPKVEGDQLTYLNYARSIITLQIFRDPNPQFWCGPGYPIMVIPFLLVFKNPKIPLIIFNVILHISSLFILNISLKRILTNKQSFFLSCIFALYFPIFQEVHEILTEPLTTFLISIIIFLSTSPRLIHSYKHQLLQGLVVGYLCLTKIIFGYVQLILFVLLVVIYFSSKNVVAKQYLRVLLFSYFISIPYLIFTYNSTSKPFLWANSGSENLYWMSTPHENEFGNWLTKDYFIFKELRPEYDTSVYAHHKTFITNVLAEKNYVKRNEMFTKAAIENIKHNPFKYGQNIIMNISRLYFGIPHTNVLQSKNNTFRILINTFVFTFSLFAFIYLIFNFKTIEPSIQFLNFLLFSYLCLTFLLSALPRQLNITIILQIFIIGYFFKHFTVNFLK